MAWPGRRASRRRGNDRFFYSPGCDRARCRHRARAARPPLRLPRRCSAPATWHDAAPRRRSRRRAARPACGRISIMRSSAVQPAGRRRGGSREATTPLGSGGADNRYAAQRVLQGASGDRLGRRPAGGVSRTATQYQRRHARMAVSSRGVAGRGLRRPRAPARSACWCQSHNHRTGENRSPGKIVVLKEIGQIRLPVRRGYGRSPSRGCL